MSNSDDSALIVVRRRNETLMNAIREAVRQELAEKGYYGVTFQGVAQRARTSKPVLYRRYSSRAHMVFDAAPIRHWDDDHIDFVASLREDLLTLFSLVVEKLCQFGVSNYRSLFAEADDELLDELNAGINQFMDKKINVVIEAARCRGELGAKPIAQPIVVSMISLLNNELFLTRKIVDRQAIAQLLDLVYLPLLIQASGHTGDTGHTEDVGDVDMHEFMYEA